MTPQEQQLIDGLVQRVNSTNLPDKDADAEQRLQQGLRSNPNAVYILAQTVIVQQFALDQAKQQLNSLREQQQQQQPPPQKHTGFLESIFGSHSDTDARPAPPPQQNQGYTPVPNQGQTYTPPPTYAPPAAYAPGPVAPASSPSGGGFLRGAAQTAAGVAAGALAFQGVESLLHGFGNSMVGGGPGFGGGGFGGNDQPREEVINNYYGGDDRGGDDRGNDRDDSRNFGGDDSRNFGGDDNNNPGDNIFTDSNDRDNNDANNFADGSDDSNSGFDDSGSFGDDSGSFGDDSGGFDDGGSSDLGNDNSF